MEQRYYKTDIETNRKWLQKGIKKNIAGTKRERKENRNNDNENENKIMIRLIWGRLLPTILKQKPDIKREMRKKTTKTKYKRERRDRQKEV